MLPSLSPLSDSPAGGVAVPPPPRFRGIRGKPRNISVVPMTYLRQRGTTAARENGLRYESKVQEFLSQLEGYITPRITFEDDSGFRLCIPDGLLLTPSQTIVFEIKVQHMPEAWWQLRKLYQPLLERFYHNVVSVVEVVRSYDPTTPFPEQITLCQFAADFENLGDKFGVFKWKP